MSQCQKALGTEPQVDIAVVEAGLGGARDATNVFGGPQLKAAVLTAVGLEHQAALGESGVQCKLNPAEDYDIQAQEVACTALP